MYVLSLSISLQIGKSFKLLDVSRNMYSLQPSKACSMKSPAQDSLPAIAGNCSLAAPNVKELMVKELMQ